MAIPLSCEFTSDRPLNKKLNFSGYSNGANNKAITKLETQCRKETRSLIFSQLTLGCKKNKAGFHWLSTSRSMIGRIELTNENRN